MEVRPPKPLSVSVSKTIELLKDTAKFKGVDGGISTFTAPPPPPQTVPTPPNVSFNDADDDNTTHVPSKHPCAWKNPLLLLGELSDENDAPTAPVDEKQEIKEKPYNKRKRYDTTADAQLRVLQKEEELQRSVLNKGGI